MSPYKTKIHLCKTVFRPVISQHSSTSPSGCTTTQPQHTWPSVILCRRSYRLEFASRRAPRSRLYSRHIQTVAKTYLFAQH